MPSLNEFHAAMEERHNDIGVIQAQADFLQEQGDLRGEAFAAACVNDVNIEHCNMSPNQSRLRLACQRIMRGDVPLNPEQLEATLRLQYELQVRLLTSLNLLQEDYECLFITAIDGNRYPLPDFDIILERMQTPEMQTWVWSVQSGSTLHSG